MFILPRGFREISVCLGEGTVMREVGPIRGVQSMKQPLVRVSRQEADQNRSQPGVAADGHHGCLHCWAHLSKDSAPQLSAVIACTRPTQEQASRNPGTEALPPPQ